MKKLTNRLLAEWLHLNYQDITHTVTDWKVQEGTDVKFNDLPEDNRKTMLFLAGRLVELLSEIK